nr:hypothetical protein [Microcystis aeruginosa]
MRNVNLNILKFLESIDNFCLSLSNIGLEVGSQLSVISHQLSVSAFFSPLPSPISHLPYFHLLGSYSVKTLK